MHSKLKNTPFFKRKTFLKTLSVFLMMPIIVLSLAHCQDENTQQPHLQLVNNIAKSTTEVVNPPKPVKTQPCMMPSLNTNIKISISEQQLYLYCHYSDREEIKTYPISTSKYGIGNQAGSNKTPLGMHRIKNKIGDGAPKGMIFKARRSTGQIATMNAEGVGDLVTTRIMWLTGLEPGVNSGPGIDSYQRYIYIHGTAEENKIGQKASHGCIRMYNNDVIHLFDLVTEGTKVHIRE